MGLLLGIILPILFIMFPTVTLLLIGKRKNKIGRIKFGVAIIGCSLLGLIAPILATYISAIGLMYNFGPDDPKCVIGAGVFLFLGYLINVIGIPIAGITLFPSKQLNKISAI